MGLNWRKMIVNVQTLMSAVEGMMGVATVVPTLKGPISAAVQRVTS
jgi:hypothetical protein